MGDADVVTAAGEGADDGDAGVVEASGFGVPAGDGPAPEGDAIGFAVAAGVLDGLTVAEGEAEARDSGATAADPQIPFAPVVGTQVGQSGFVQLCGAFVWHGPPHTDAACAAVGATVEITIGSAAPASAAAPKRTKTRRSA